MDGRLSRRGVPAERLGLQLCSTENPNIIDPLRALGRAVSPQGSGAEPLVSQHLSPEAAFVSSFSRNIPALKKPGSKHKSF